MPNPVKPSLSDAELEVMRDWVRQLAEAANGGALAVHIIEPAEWGAVVEAAEPLEGADADHASPLHNSPMPAPWLMTAALASRSSVVARLT